MAKDNNTLLLIGGGIALFLFMKHKNTVPGAAVTPITNGGGLAMQHLPTAQQSNPAAGVTSVLASLVNKFLPATNPQFINPVTPQVQQQLNQDAQNQYIDNSGIFSTDTGNNSQYMASNQAPAQVYNTPVISPDAQAQYYANYQNDLNYNANGDMVAGRFSEYYN